jgi:hypothetical protein
MSNINNIPKSALWIYMDSTIKNGGTIVFRKNDTEYIKFMENGDIYVYGRLVENDKEVVQGMRDLLGIKH